MVDTWDPNAQATELTEAVLLELQAAAARLEADDFGLSADAITRLAGVARTDRVDWQAASENLDAATLEALIRLYTLAEGCFPAWEAGAQSPVIAIAKVLRARGAYPQSLTAWVKANTDNKFLPYGSLLDRL